MTAIERVVKGARYIHPRVSEVLAEAFEGKRKTSEMLPDKLTPRAAEVLALVANDLSNRRITEALGVRQR